MKDFFSLFSPNRVFQSSGKNLQRFAKSIYTYELVGAICYIIGQLIYIGTKKQEPLVIDFLHLFLLPIAIVVGGWVSSVFIYGFGVIVEKFENEREPAARARSSAPASPTSSDSEKLSWSPAPVSQPAAPAATPVSRPGAPVPPSVRPAQSTPRNTAPWVCPVCDRHNSAQVLVCACGKHQPR